MTAVRFLWAVLSPFVDEKIKRRLIFNKTSVCDEVVQAFHPSQLEVKYGGEAEDKTVWWPPPMPDSQDYGTDSKKLAPVPLESTAVTDRKDNKDKPKEVKFVNSSNPSGKML